MGLKYSGWKVKGAVYRGWEVKKSVVKYRSELCFEYRGWEVE